MDKIIVSGKLIVYKKEHSFDFDGKQLRIKLYDDEESRRLLYTKYSNGGYGFSGGNPLPSEYISGIALPENKRIVFKVQTENYGISNIIMVNDITDIYVNVYRYMFIDKSYKKNTKTTLSYKSSYFHHFLNLIPNYKLNQTDSLIANIEINKKIIEEQEAKFYINKIEYSIKPNCSYTCGIGKFVFMPELTLSTTGDIDIDEIWKLYDTFCKTIRFIFLRNNIYPDEFEVVDKHTKYLIYEREWDFDKEKDEDFNKPNIFHSARWFRIYENFGNIFNYFYSNKGNNILSSLFSNKKERYVYSKHLISSDAAAFEHIFDELYPNFNCHSEKTKVAINEVKTEINEILSNCKGKKREIYKGLLKQVDHVLLKNKLSYAFKEYKQCFEKYNGIGKRKVNYNEIAEICSKYRNDIDHGNDGIILDNNICEKLVYMRLIYIVLYYHSFGVDNSTISEVIYDLFSQ